MELRDQRGELSYLFFLARTWPMKNHRLFIHYSPSNFLLPFLEVSFPCCAVTCMWLAQVADRLIFSADPEYVHLCWRNICPSIYFRSTLWWPIVEPEQTPYSSKAGEWTCAELTNSVYCHSLLSLLTLETESKSFPWIWVYALFVLEALQVLSSLVAQLVKNPLAMWETWVRSLGWEDPLEKGKATYSSILD